MNFHESGAQRSTTRDYVFRAKGPHERSKMLFDSMLPGPATEIARRFENLLCTELSRILYLHDTTGYLLMSCCINAPRTIAGIRTRSIKRLFCGEKGIVGVGRFAESSIHTGWRSECGVVCFRYTDQISEFDRKAQCLTNGRRTL